MPPKQRFTHDLILEKAYGMFLEGGMDAVNARSVSKALKCSTQPIFSYFPDMGGLRSEIIEKGIQEFNDVMSEGQNSSIIDHCCAYIKFARKQPKVYGYLLTLKDNDGVSPIQLKLSDGEEIPALSEEAQKSVIDKMIKYTVGCATLAAINTLKYTEEETEKELKEFYSDLIQIYEK